MTTLPELINEIAAVREAIDMIEIKGQQNRMLINFAYEKCTKLIEALNSAMKEIQAQENQNGSQPEANPEESVITEFPKSEETTEG